MIKAKTIIGAEFHRPISTTSIDVFLKGSERSISLFANNIDNSSKHLSKNEIDTVIQILLIKKESMSRKGDFPYIYDEMLTDLITVYKERYGKQDRKGKNWKNHYTLSANQLKYLIEKRYTFNEVRIDSVSAGISDSEATKIEVGSDGILYVSFSEVVGDE